MALLLQTLLLFLSMPVLSSQELQNERNLTNSGGEVRCQGNDCNLSYSSPPPPYQSIPIYGPPPPPSSGQGPQPPCPPSSVPCCQYAPSQPNYYYPPQPYLTPSQPFGYQPYSNYSGTSRLMLYDGFVLGLCFLFLRAFV